ncbi:DUF2690 domain-containing protein [Streptomyces xylophagus]|uniref:DUF2690 domain-containing protein n=1 Tax=Streptomyces xylophagus TaxID=285514 RepID=UPI0005B7E5DC|nr:DUF2690 domain-containing protein [Streptomyces xylophagus]
MKVRNWGASVTVLVLAAAGTAIATPASAAGCYGSSCEGKDPAAYCQSDAITPSNGAVWLGPAYVELRYSPSCRAAWARISHAPYVPQDQSTPWATVHRTSDGKEYTCSVPQGATGCYTKMVNDINVKSFAKGMYDGGAQIWQGSTGSY